MIDAHFSRVATGRGYYAKNSAETLKTQKLIMKTWQYIPHAFLLSTLLCGRTEGAVGAEPAPPGMVTIPSGAFTMGSPTTENGRDFWPFVVADETQHEVTITKPFYMKETEVTKAEWDDVWRWAAFNGYPDLPEGHNGFNGNDFGNHPVTEVSWYDSVKWCNAKSELEGLLSRLRQSSRARRAPRDCSRCTGAPLSLARLMNE